MAIPACIAITERGWADAVKRIKVIFDNNTLYTVTDTNASDALLVIALFDDWF